MTNTNKLKGRIVEKGFNLETFSSKLGITRQAFSRKINGRADFKASEIAMIVSLLDIPKTEVVSYFFS